MTGRRQSRGMTLIEVLVAMAIFAILAALAYGSLNQTLASADILGERMTRLQAIQRAIRQIESDFMQLAPRPVRAELAERPSPALEIAPFGIGLALSRAGWSNPTALPRGTLQRVAYFIENDELVRAYWNVLDRTASSVPVEVTLLDDVELLDIRFMTDNGEWIDEWPPGQPGQLAAGDALRLRPRAVEVLIVLPAEGEIRRLIEVAP